MTAVGGENTAGKYLKTSVWGGEDKFGFATLPGGRGYSDGYFYSAGDYGLWWSSSESAARNAYYRYMYYNYEYAYYNYGDKSYLFSVRCLQD
jgi:uncharacterized protein (TIGR02145 family)